MKTQKLKRLKKGVTVIVALNCATCFICEAIALYAALRLHNMTDSLIYFSGAIINSAAFWFMATLKDAIISELEERRVKVKEVKTNARKSNAKNVKSA